MFSGLSKSLGLTKISDKEHNATMKKKKTGPYSLPSEDSLATEKSVLVNELGQNYRIATMEDFARFRDLCLNEEGWTERHRTPKIVVFDKPNEKGSLGDSLNNIKVVNIFPKVKASVLYDALHDPDFRKTWDTNMIEGFNICQLDPRNDIGYYAVSFPWPLTSREFINMRCWMEMSNGDYIILNRTVLHPDYPCTQKHVRGVSYLSGYYISPLKNVHHHHHQHQPSETTTSADSTSAADEGEENNSNNNSTTTTSTSTSPPEATSTEIPADPEDGCRMIFFTHGDIQGSVPHSLINMAYTKMTPSMMAKLEENAIRYSEWWKEIGRDDSFLPTWRTTPVSWEAEKNVEIGELVVKAVSAAAAGFSEDDDDGELKIEEFKKSLLMTSDSQEAQQFNGMIEDAFSFLQRRFDQHEKKQPKNMKEFCQRLLAVVKGVKKATSLVE